MKTFFDLLHGWKFLSYLLILILLIIWNFFEGSQLLAVIFLSVLVIAVSVNLYKTNS